MAAGPRSLLAFWLGGAAAPPGGSTQAGVRGLLAPWIGGASAPVVRRPSVRSLLAPWIGGASKPPTAASSAGVRGMLAFWLGGASAGVQTAPPDSSGGGLLHAIYAHRKRQQDVEQARKRLEVLDERRLEVSTDLAEQRAMAAGRRTHSLARAEKLAARRAHSIQLEQTRLLALISQAQEQAYEDDAIAVLLLALA